MFKATIFSFLILMFAQPACAASFDCTKASTKVEKMICGDPELSELDEILGREYKKASASSTNLDLLKQQQKEWIKSREQCDTRLCVKGQYAARLSYFFKLNSPVKEIVTDKPVQAPAVKQMGPYTFKFEKDNGWTVCQKALENMEFFSPTQGKIACGESVNLSDGLFQEPAWEELPIDKHWKQVYEIDTSPDKLHGRNVKPFDVWKKDYQALIEAGKIHPRLRHVVFKLPAKNFKQFEDQKDFKPYDYFDTEFFGYTRNRNNVADCKSEIKMGVYRNLIKYTGDRIRYFNPTQKSFEFLSSNSTFSDPATYYDVASRFGKEERIIMYDSVPYLVSALPFPPDGHVYSIHLYRIFGYAEAGQSMVLGYSGQHICTIEATSKQ